MSIQFDCSDSGFTSTLVKDESELVLVSSNVKNEDAFKSNNIHFGRLFTMSSQCDFSDSGFHNTVVKEESELVIINTSKNSITLAFFSLRKAKTPHISKYKNNKKSPKFKRKYTKNLAIFGCISGVKPLKNGLTYPSLTLPYSSLTLT